MQRTRIEWVKNEDGIQGYTINPVQGLCPVGCEYCYARAMYKRFKWDPTIRYDPRAWLGIGSLRKPSRIFVGSTMELFHDSLSPTYLKWIMEVPLEFPQHTFIFLTKLPQNLPKEWPDNCWVGVTATNKKMAWDAMKYLKDIQATVRFISFEPLLGQIPNDPIWPLLDSLKNCRINWLLIGQATPVRKSTMPKMEWVREIVEAADKAGVPVFLKNNLASILPVNEEWCDWGPHEGGYGAELRQEFPIVKEGQRK